jgi:signal transduction histidine kinase
VWRPASGIRAEPQRYGFDKEIVVTPDNRAAGCLEVLSRVMNVGLLLAGSAGRLEFANTLALELLGCESEEELQQRWTEFRRLLQIDVALPTSAVKPKRITVNFPLAKGMRFLRLEIHTPHEEACTGCLVLLKDRQAGDILETDLLLASRMRSLVHVYRVLAHDLKAPLNAMQLTLELLADSVGHDAGSDGRGRRQRHVEVLREELARLNRILQTMLDQKEPMDAVPQIFDLREVIREVVVLLAPQARGQRVEMRTQVPEATVPLRGYRDRLKQALLNIAINGLEAMPGGGRLAIDLTAQATGVCVRIADTGSGIPEELLDEIDQIYFTTKKTGSGIGLYVARLVVESHGGAILVRSDLGAGACFTVNLPLGTGMGGADATEHAHERENTSLL